MQVTSVVVKSIFKCPNDGQSVESEASFNVNVKWTKYLWPSLGKRTLTLFRLYDKTDTFDTIRLYPFKRFMQAFKRFAYPFNALAKTFKRFAYPFKKISIRLTL